MAGNGFTEISRQSWFGRIGSSIRGVLVGLVLFVVSFPLLWWNEGRAVARYRALTEGAAVVVSVSADSLDPQHDGKLVHLGGRAVTDETLEDEVFGVSAVALKLRRRVQMYQWEEKKTSRTRKKLGGGSETVTTYDYHKTWADRVIDSQTFRQPQGHENPGSMPYAGAAWQAERVTVGAFRLASSLVDRLTAFEPLAADSRVLPEALRDTLQATGTGFYQGSDPAVPQIGDIRISHEAVRPLEVSLVAGQSGDILGPFSTPSGGQVELLQVGTHTAAAMFQRAESQNRSLTWLLRLAGFVAMAVGLGLFLRPFSVVADVIPFLGSVVGFGIGLTAGLSALFLSLVTIGIAWVAHRPLVGIGLLAAAAAISVLLVWRARAARSAARGSGF